MSRRPGRWWKPTGPQYRRPAQVSRARQAAWPAIQWAKGWDQGAKETREALDGENAYDAGYDTGRESGRKELREELADLGTYTAEEVMESFRIGFDCGRIDERKRWEDLDLMYRARAADPERFRQLSAALEDGGIDAARQLVREWQCEDLLDVAGSAGVTPLADVDPGDLADEVERWLQGGAE
ncbi:hypothetical protein [Micromonospora globbae]|uniref:Uncharacterized protein n=1 Tax=Micromonospora globbae TaxID=1894969 RepID=A0A420F274_9ACTN|nr:hypothetical protein [Micromonospora globbae]RKF27051.1 hypothetical protein D7I43_11220 [Micromonospora globbae]